MPGRERAARRTTSRMVLDGAAAGLASLVVMAAVSALAFAQLDAGSLPAMTAATVALAVGGSVNLSTPDAARAGELGAGLHGTLDLMPLGVTLVGAVVLVVVFLAPMRQRTTTPAELVVRAGAATGTVLAFLTVAAVVTRGRLPLSALGLGGGGDPPAGELRERLGGDRRRNPDLGGLGRGGADRPGAAEFTIDVPSTVVAGLLWVLVVLAVGWVAARRAPLPTGWEWAQRIRPALSATVTVLLVLTSIGTATGLALAALGRGGPLTAGLVFGASTGVLVVLALGIGVPWSASAGGSIADLLPADRVPRGELSLVQLSDWGLWWLPTAFAGVTLLVCGVLAAVRDPRTGEPRLRRAVSAGARLGVVLAMVLAVSTLLAGISVDIGISVFGTEFTSAELDLRANVPLALGLGLAGGAVAGFVGYLLRDLLPGRPAHPEGPRSR